MFKSFSLLAVAALFAFTGCDTATGPAERNGALAPEPSGKAVSELATAGKTGGISARGGAHFIVPADVFGAEVGNILTFNARKDGGAVSGHYNYHQTFQGETFKFNGPVTCFNVYDGNRAKVGGLVEISNDPTIPPGDFIWWSVIDNGQGEGASADESTIIGVGDDAANEAFCNNPAVPRFGPWEIAGGNFHVDD